MLVLFRITYHLDTGVITKISGEGRSYLTERGLSVKTGPRKNHQEKVEVS